MIPLGIRWLRSSDCCVFWPAFGCCTHPKTGQTTFFSRFQPFLIILISLLTFALIFFLFQLFAQIPLKYRISLVPLKYILSQKLKIHVGNPEALELDHLTTWTSFRSILLISKTLESEIWLFFICLPSEFLPASRLTGRWCAPHLALPCFLARGLALIWGLYPDWFECFVNWVHISVACIAFSSLHMYTVQ